MAGSERQLRKALPKSDRSVAPPPGFKHLAVEVGAYGGEPLLVDKGAEAGPSAPVGFDLRNAAVVMVDQRGPERPTVAHPIAPRHVVEPQQILVRHAFQIRDASRDRRRILSSGIASGRC